MQWKLGVTADGSFGPITKEALQRYLHVTADGIIGPVTVKALQAQVLTALHPIRSTRPT
jgi:peptidoglycan hydrolase-like protein with peptidoglycan-binding domain